MNESSTEVVVEVFDLATETVCGSGG